MRKTRAGIDCIDDIFFAHAKILSGIEAKNYRLTAGPDMPGWYGHEARKLAQKIGDQMPFVIDRYNDLCTGGAEFFEFISRRGIFCLPENLHKHGKNEMKRFVAEDFSASMDLMKEVSASSAKILRIEHILEVREKILLDLAETGACLYARDNPRIVGDIYVGVTENIVGRKHTGNPLYLARTYALSSIEKAEAIESIVHKWLLENGAYSRTGRGWFSTDFKDPVAELDKFLLKYYGFLMSNTGTVFAEIKETARAKQMELL